VVNLRSDADVALRGWLARARGGWLELVDVEALRAAGPPQRIDGGVVIHRSNVAFIQVLADGDRQ
jgi:hypothetical protein